VLLMLTALIQNHFFEHLLTLRYLARSSESELYGTLVS
jgi:hypothetical protein